MRNYFLRFLLPLAIIYPHSSALFAQEFNIDKEISRLRKDLASVTSQRKTVKEEVLKDEKEFAAYTDRSRKRIETTRLELDSIQRDIKKQSLINDSLTSATTSLQNSIRQADLLQDHFRGRVVSGCDLYLKTIEKFPPMINKPIKSSLSFLQSELIAKNIDNVEGFQRLSQILKDIEEATSSIQTVQCSSPIAEIRGTAYQVRIGTLMEAVVNSEGTAYALWDGYDPNGKEIWTKGTDTKIAEQLLKCVNVREGRTLPSFVELPITGKHDSGVAK